MNQPRSLLQAEAQRIEHAVDVAPCPRPSLYSEAGWFVQHDDEVIPVDDHAPHLRRVAIRHHRGPERLGALGGRNGRRQTDGLAGLDAVPGLATPPIDPYLT